jgi:transposase
MLRGLAKEIPCMLVQVTAPERTALETAAAAERRVRRWRRYQAVVLLAAGQPPAVVAQSLRCSRASVYAWAAAWRQEGLVGLQEGAHGGGWRKLDAAGEAILADLLAVDPQSRGHQATGWTVPLLRGELAQAGYMVGARTIRRALHRLGYRWKRPQYVLGRPDPAYAEKRGP